MAFRSHFLNMLPDLSPATFERAALVTMMQAKGAPQERDFALASREVPRLFQDIAALARKLD